MATPNPYTEFLQAQRKKGNAKAPAQTPPDYSLNPSFPWMEKQLVDMGTPFPDRNQDYGYQQLPEELANIAAGSVAGMAGAANRTLGGVNAFGSDMYQWLTHKPLQSEPSASSFTTPDDPTHVKPNTANALDEFLKTLKLDQTSTIPGSGQPMPAYVAPQTGVARPDYSKMDALLASAKPRSSQLQDPSAERSDAGWQGVSDAAGQIRNLDSPAAALGQLIGGYNQGSFQTRQMQQARELDDQKRMDEYNLKLAGVEGTRAADEAHYRSLQQEQENNAVQAKLNYDMQAWQLGQAHVQMLGDGSIAATRVDPHTGATTIQRVGQEDALRTEMMLSQLKAQYGQRGVNAAFQQAQQTYGPVLGSVVAGFADMSNRPGMLETIIPLEAQKQIDEALKAKGQDLLNQGYNPGSKEYIEALDREKKALQFQMILGNPQSQAAFQQWLGGSHPQAAPSQPASPAMQSRSR